MTTPITPEVSTESYQNNQVELEPKAQLYLNNLEAIINVPETARKLSSLWNTKRDDFFIFLASWLEENLAASDINLIYNDLKEVKSDEEKPQLVKVVLTKEVVAAINTEEDDKAESENTWKKNSLTQAHESLLKQYESSLKLEPQLLELSTSSFTIGGELKGSPFIILGKLTSCNSLQQSLLAGLLKEIKFLTSK